MTPQPGRFDLFGLMYYYHHNQAQAMRMFHGGAPVIIPVHHNHGPETAEQLEYPKPSTIDNILAQLNLGESDESISDGPSVGHQTGANDSDVAGSENTDSVEE